MSRKITATAKFVRKFLRPTQDAHCEREVMFPGGRQATVYLPQGGRAAPCWLLLHGVTVPGRHHSAARRMARALAAAGQAAVIPDVPAWSSLNVDVQETLTVIRESLTWIEGERPFDAGRVGLMGFSVAATWALAAAAGPYHGRFRSVVAVGGYASWRSVLLAMVAGEREPSPGGAGYAPDPYGRWIMGANLLPLLEGDQWGPPVARREAAAALRQLALTAGRNGALADSPIYNPLNAGLRARLPATVHHTWDTIAPLSNTRVAPRARELARALADAALGAEPALDPAGRLDSLSGHVILLHGRQDRLIPCEETVRLAALLPRAAQPHVTITRLMGHTKPREARWPRDPRALTQELAAIAGCFENILASIDG